MHYDEFLQVYNWMILTKWVGLVSYNWEKRIKKNIYVYYFFQSIKVSNIEWLCGKGSGTFFIIIISEWLTIFISYEDFFKLTIEWYLQYVHALILAIGKSQAKKYIFTIFFKFLGTKHRVIMLQT